MLIKDLKETNGVKGREKDQWHVRGMTTRGLSIRHKARGGNGVKEDTRCHVKEVSVSRRLKG